MINFKVLHIVPFQWFNMLCLQDSLRWAVKPQIIIVEAWEPTTLWRSAASGTVSLRRCYTRRNITLLQLRWIGTIHPPAPGRNRCSMVSKKGITHPSPDSHLQTILGKFHFKSLPAHPVLIGNGKRSWLAVLRRKLESQALRKLNPAITVLHRGRMGEIEKEMGRRDARGIVAGMVQWLLLVYTHNDDCQDWMIKLCLNLRLELHLRYWRTPKVFSLI